MHLCDSVVACCCHRCRKDAQFRVVPVFHLNTNWKKKTFQDAQNLEQEWEMSCRLWSSVVTLTTNPVDDDSVVSSGVKQLFKLLYSLKTRKLKNPSCFLCKYIRSWSLFWNNSEVFNLENQMEKYLRTKEKMRRANWCVIYEWDEKGRTCEEGVPRVVLMKYLNHGRDIPSGYFSSFLCAFSPNVFKVS